MFELKYNVANDKKRKIENLFLEIYLYVYLTWIYGLPDYEGGLGLTSINRSHSRRLRKVQSIRKF